MRSLAANRTQTPKKCGPVTRIKTWGRIYRCFPQTASNLRKGFSSLLPVEWQIGNVHHATATIPKILVADVDGLDHYSLKSIIYCVLESAWTRCAFRPIRFVSIQFTPLESFTVFLAPDV
jgi:hypothetical protein